MKLSVGKKYFDKAAHRIVWYKGIETRQWCGETIREYVFEDVCDCIIKHDANKFDVNKWIENSI